MNDIHRLVWLKRNNELTKKMEHYCENYRKNKCSQCTEEQRGKRKCRVYSSGRTYCEPMISARVKKFKNIIISEILLLVGIETGNIPKSF